MSPKQGGNALPPKEHTHFKHVVKYYETKQLKKALKSADAILKRFPDHGETLAMKGLTLNALDRKAEATELVRRGLRMDTCSHICWHVYGLLYRSDRNYREAAKAYLVALRLDKDNQQILRDLALLQVQIRDYEGLEDTRRTLLTVRPSQRNNWIGFALSFHLLRNYATAVSVLDTYQETLKQSTEVVEDRYEVSELLLYKNFILEESGDFATALNHLDDSRAKLVDHLTVRETRARLLSALGRFQEAIQEFHALLRINPDNHLYQKGLQACAIRFARCQRDDALNGNADEDIDDDEYVKLSYGARKLKNLERQVLGPLPTIQSSEDVKCALNVCDELTAKYSRSRTAPRMALDVLPSGNHPEFVPRLDSYVRKFLRRGVPSLFSDVKGLYIDPSKAEAIGKLFETYRCNLEDPDMQRLPNLLPMPEEEESSLPNGNNDALPVDEESPSTLLWVLHFLAQHYDRLGKCELALTTIDAAIEHTPTAIECYLVKARILKHCGDLKSAVAVTDEARNLDLADRYLNTKCSKYALRADMVTEAETWVGLFTRDADSGGVQALYDMQCMWFELEAAESHFRRGELAPALKKFTAVDRHFADMHEDQFDFHSYCLRKVTLRSYVNLLRFEDRIRSHPYYSRAASGLLKCLLKLYDLPERERAAITGEHSDIKGYANMTDAERKKAVSKRKKQLARKRQAQQAGVGGKGGMKSAPNGNEKNQGGNDPSGKQSAAGNNENKPKASSGWMEQDPNGRERVKELYGSEGKKNSILDEAASLVKELQRHLEYEMQTHVLSFEVALRRKKYLQALRAVNRARRIDREDPQALLISVRLAYELGKQGVEESFSETVRTVYSAQEELVDSKEVVTYTKEYLERNGEYAERRVGGNRCMLWLAKAEVKGVESVEEVCKSICRAIDESDGEGVGKNVLSAAFCRQLLLELRQEGLKKELVAGIQESCQAKYPRASCFSG